MFSTKKMTSEFLSTQLICKLRFVKLCEIESKMSLGIKKRCKWQKKFDHVNTHKNKYNEYGKTVEVLI